MPHRVKLTDSGKDVLVKLSEGNPGALSVLLQWVRYGALIDPDAVTPWIQMLALDDLDLVGPRIWVLYKDVCGEDLRRFLGVLRAHQLGFLSTVALQTLAARGQFPPTADQQAVQAARVDALLAKVEAQLVKFIPAADWAVMREATGV